MDIEFLKSVLSIPNPSGHENFISETIENWCAENGIATKKDGKGNLFLKKGYSKYYPCFTSHLDSVLDGPDAKKAVDEKQLLEIVQHGDILTAKLNGKPCVIGCDCKNGIAIALQCMKKLRAAKAAFYVQEELGCRGVQGSSMDFFSDCSFVIGLDSPEFNRAAKSCLGLPLFSEKFFTEQLEPICKKHGLTNFRAEPGTDIFFIRKDANNNPADKNSRIECINFGNGGYNEHSDREYASISDVNKSEALAFDLAKTIDNKAWFSAVPPPPPPPPRPHMPIWFQPQDEIVDIDLEKAFWNGEHDKRAARGRKKGIPEDSYVGIAFQFSNTAKYIKFISGKALDLGIELDEDNDENIATISGPLSEVKKAYLMAFNIEEGTDYADFKEFKKAESDTDFWDELYIPGEQQNNDDLPPETDAEDDSDSDNDIDPIAALENFWKKYK